MARSNTMTRNTALMAGIAVGAAAAGAIAAMLTTPKSGKEMRSTIKTKANQSRDKAMEQAHTMKDRMHSKTDDVRDKALDATEAARGTLHDVTDKATDTARGKVSEASDRSKEVSDHIEEEMRRRGHK